MDTQTHMWKEAKEIKGGSEDKQSRCCVYSLLSYRCMLCPATAKEKPITPALSI